MCCGLTHLPFTFLLLRFTSDQAEAHRAKAKAARERRANRVAAKKEAALAEYSAAADQVATAATAAR